MRLVDSHCHLEFSDFPDIEAVIARAESQHISPLLSIGTRLDHLHALVELTHRFPSVYGTVGLHPHEAEKNSLEELRTTLLTYSHEPKIVGFGETGLDFYYDHSDRARQEESFRCHIQAALTENLPLVVHTRAAEAETIRLLKEEGKGNLRGVIHCFTGTAWLAEAALALGFYISLSGIITFKNAEAIREVVKNIPLDRLLVETDAPYLAPVPHRGKRNEPAFVRYTAEKVADLKNLSLEEVATATTGNFFDLFTKIPSLTP